LFERASAVATPAEIAATIGYLHTNGIGAGFSYSVDPDRKNSTRYLLELSQGGLGMPDRDYYFLEDERSKKLRDGYRTHVRRMFELLDDPPEVAARNADNVIRLETELAKVSMTATERRDVDKTYNRKTVAELAADAPGFPWDAYLDAMRARNVADLNVAQPEFMKAFAKLADDASATGRRTCAGRSSTRGAQAAQRFEDEHFDFYERQFRA
jgi:predicted metalloendopeptidase